MNVKMKSKEEVLAEIERVSKILKDKADQGDKSDWDYYTFYSDGLKWVLGEHD